MSRYEYKVAPQSAEYRNHLGIRHSWLAIEITIVFARKVISRLPTWMASNEFLKCLPSMFSSAFVFRVFDLRQRYAAQALGNVRHQFELLLWRQLCRLLFQLLNGELLAHALRS